MAVDINADINRKEFFAAYGRLPPRLQQQVFRESIAEIGTTLTQFALSRPSPFRKGRRLVPAGATGLLRQQTVAQRGRRSFSNEHVLIFGSATPYARRVHEGQRAGTYVSPKNLVTWVERVLSVSKDRSYGVAVAISNAIFRGGTKRQPYLSYTLRQNTQRIINIVGRNLRRFIQRNGGTV